MDVDTRLAAGVVVVVVVVVLLLHRLMLLHLYGELLESCETCDETMCIWHGGDGETETRGPCKHTHQ